MSDATCWFEAGRLMCGYVRDMLELERFNGARLEWREGRGILSRRFDVRGDDAAIRRVAAWVSAMESDA